MRVAVTAVLAILALAACSSADGGSPSSDAPPAGDEPQQPSGPSASSPGGDDGGAPHPDGAPPNDASTPKDAAGDAHPDAKPDGNVGNGCPVLVYPSGVKIQTFKDAAMTATYMQHLAAGESAPTCFLDANNLLDPDTGTVQPLTVNVATNFQLEELVGTEIAQGYGHLVLMEPAAVASLQKFREEVGVPVSVNSGFRSPKHQEAVCNGLCGNPLGCPGTCANNSRHMFGDAFDLPLEFYTATDEDRACAAGFKFAYLESGTHLHIDQNPAYKTCVKE